MRFTVLGGRGFIGSHLTVVLRSQGVACEAPVRGEDVLQRPLGHVIYCVGLTADFRSRPFDTVEAHVGYLARLLREADFESFLYLSTTRVYAGAGSTEEGADLRVNPTRPDDLYNVSKLMGESLCLNCGRPGIRVARLSNVYGGDLGSENFLPSVIRDALEKGKVTFRTALGSAKDYVSVADAVSLLAVIAATGQRPIYNVAAGANTTHAEIADAIGRLTGCTIEIAPGAETVAFPAIQIDRVRAEFGFAPTPLLDSIGALVNQFRETNP